MKQCSKFCCGVWPFVILPLVVLVLAIGFSWRNIEKDVSNNAHQALVNGQATWAQIENHNLGRDIRLLGNSKTEQDRDSAINIALNANGVRTVSWEGRIVTEKKSEERLLPSKAKTEVKTKPKPTPEPFQLSIAKTNDVLIVTGTSSSKIDTALFTHIDTSNYQADGRFEKFDALNKILTYLQSSSDSLSVEINHQELKLIGNIDALGKSKQYESDFNKLFDGKVINELKVELAALQEEELVSNSQCQSLFNALTETETVNFEVSKATVLPASYELLDKFTRLSRRCPSATFKVIGHTDNTGDSNFNLDISLQRAQSVVKHIVNSGVNESRFVALGLGDTKPLSDNKTEDGRAKNRRVEFVVLDHPTPKNGNNKE